MLAQVVKTGPFPVFINKVLLEHGQRNSFTCVSEAASTRWVKWMWQLPGLRSLKNLLPSSLQSVLTLIFSKPRRPCHYRLCGKVAASRQATSPIGNSIVCLLGLALLFRDSHSAWLLSLSLFLYSPWAWPYAQGGGLSHHYHPQCSAQNMTNRTVRWGLFLSKDQFRAFMQQMFVLNVPQL